MNLHLHFVQKNKFAAIRSKRMQKAVIGLMDKAGAQNSDDAPYFLDAAGHAKPAKK